MNILNAPLKAFDWYDDLKIKFAKDAASIRFNGCIDLEKLHIIDFMATSVDVALIVTYSETRARQIVEDYAFYNSDVLYYPAKDMIFYQSDVNGKQLAVQRLEVLDAILNNKKCTVVTTIDAFMAPMMPADIIKNNIVHIDMDSLIDEHAIALKLTRMGYEKVYQVENKGEFSIRGGIVDIYDLTKENPVRIELWGDNIESIRSFDVLSQRSVEKLTEVTIFPASELLLSDDVKQEGFERIKKDAETLEKKYREDFKTQEAYRIKLTLEEIETGLFELSDEYNMESYIKYFYPEVSSLIELISDKQSCIFIDEYGRTMEHARAVEMEFRESMIHRLEGGYVLPGQTDILRSVDKTLADILRVKNVTLTSLNAGEHAEDEIKYDGDYYVHARLMPSFNGSYSLLREGLEKLKEQKYKIVIVSPSRSRAKRLADDLTGDGVIATYTEDIERSLQSGEIAIIYGRLQKGFEYPTIKFSVISDMDIFGSDRKKKKRKVPKYTGGTRISSSDQLFVGDYVIHENHGIGIYKGIEKVSVDHVLKDYMKIEYKDGGNLYVLATNLDMIQFYASKDSKQPKLNKLGTQEWNKTKAKVKLSVNEVAKDLVHLYAVRSAKKGFEYGPDTVWQKEFEELFPYNETADQLTAIEATKKDMESPKIMDRLICGDVGFGKTEVAIRAAFKAVQEGKQVAYLVPTTILAQQHYNTFASRMKDYPVRVEMLSRFRTAGEVRKVLADMKKGLVDIVIGTHRLLSKDVEFTNLGLLIVDEEQRFGVSHKEKIKKLKENVDVLTLTATPIPRTLHMSLIGIRDMSLLEEAPMDRQPIQTYVMEYNDEMVREAINRELSRGGQVYYVYNRVNDIMDVAARVQKLVPDARVTFAHGQMEVRELENIMMDFVDKKIDVLVATTIIETGLDIPNVNTMIIHDSDSLGLSQLYQLRGRVGRSTRTSFAFLMYKRNKVLKEVAEKRLMAIREFTELGSGFKIAMRDWEIRGAGTLLGKQQHGHMQAVGYDLYCKMLDEAIKEEKGIETVAQTSATVDLDVGAYIPESYIVNEVQKLDIYKRIACIKNEEDREEMRDELIDRFGKVPDEANNLLRVASIKQVATSLYIKDLRGRTGLIKLVMHKDAPVKTENIVDLLNEYGGDLRINLVGDPTLTLVYDIDGLVEKDEVLLLEKTEELLGYIKQHLY